MLSRGDPAHWRDESRGGVRRPTSPVLPATPAGRPVPGSAHIAIFSPRPGTTRHPAHATYRPRGHPKTQRFSQIARVDPQASEIARVLGTPRVP